MDLHNIYSGFQMKPNEIELIILGSGTCIPSADRGPAAIVVKIDSDILLFDSGSGTLNKLAIVGIDYKELNYLFYTHVHPDHTSDLIPILQAIRVSPEFQRSATLQIFGPLNFKNFVNQLAQAYGNWVIDSNYDIIIRELSQDQFNLTCAKISTRAMKHSKISIGYRIESINNKSIVYSGDTDYCEEIVELAQNCDLLILECSFPDDQKMDGHLTPTLAATIAAEANCKHLVLTHFYPIIEHIDIISICRKIYSGKISIAHDFKKFIL